ncbi:MAG: zf-TFIIB domain-containing protein [Bryobacteraceae bacterium]
MFRTYDRQNQQPDRQHVLLTQQLLGVLGEETYFARQDAEQARKLAANRHAALVTEEREQARAKHFMKCPKCGMQLDEIAFGGINVDKCFSCEGLWLDKGESDLLRQKDDGFMTRLLGVFGG